MAHLDLVNFQLCDANSHEEIEGLPLLPTPAVIPRAGERIHYWQDGFPEAAGVDSGIRRDFQVEAVEHDWRYMPARVGGGSSRFCPTVILYVTEIPQPEEK